MKHTTPIRCVNCKYKQNAVICKSHKPIFYSQQNIKKTYQMLKLRHFTNSWKILAHFDCDGSNTGARKGWKSNWRKSKANVGAFDN